MSDLEKQAFTVGHAASYDSYLWECLTKDEPAIKLGAYKDYRGGCVWKTLDEARAFLQTEFCSETFGAGKFAEFRVYELELPTGWDVDVSESHQDGVRDLLHDSVIVGPA